MRDSLAGVTLGGSVIKRELTWGSSLPRISQARNCLSAIYFCLIRKRWRLWGVSLRGQAKCLTRDGIRFYNRQRHPQQHLPGARTRV